MPSPSHLRIASFNVNCSASNASSFLETHTDFDLVLFQELRSRHIRNVPSAYDPHGTPLHGLVAHPEWICIHPSDAHNARVATYVNRRLAHLSPTRSSRLDHPDILLVTLTLAGRPISIINLYSDPANHTGIQHLLDHMPPGIDLVAGDFNMHHPSWSIPMGIHPRPASRHADDTCDMFLNKGMVLAFPHGDTPTHYPHNTALRVSALDLVWVDVDHCNSDDLRVTAHPDERLLSDHAPISITLPCNPVPDIPPCIPKGSERDGTFTSALVAIWDASLDLPVSTADELEHCSEFVFTQIQATFAKLAKPPNITRKSKPWWNQACSSAIAAYRQDSTPQNKRAYWDAVKSAKRSHYEGVIASACGKGRLWDLTSWVKERRLAPTSSLRGPNGEVLSTHAELRDGFRQQFFSSNNIGYDPSIINEIPARPIRTCPSISLTECFEALSGTVDSAPGFDHASWSHVKNVVRSERAGQALLRFFNACLNLGYWPQRLKQSTTVVIPKPNKPDYTVLKAYRPIVLLSCFGKLFEKVLANRFQFDATKHGLFHSSQFGGTIAHCTEDAGLLIHQHIAAAKAKGLVTSCLSFDIQQCFPSVNHDFLTQALTRFGFHAKYISFLAHYLSGRETSFLWNGRRMDPCNASVGVGQGSALSPVLTNLAVAVPLHIFATQMTQPSPDAFTSLVAYVDDGCLSQSSDNFETNNLLLNINYGTLTTLFNRAGFRADEKLGFQQFPRRVPDYPEVQGARVPGPPPPPPPLTLPGGVILRSTPVWRILGFFFDPQLTFRAHVRFYANKALSTLNALPLLGNSVRGINPTNKRRLFIACIRPLLTYGCNVWFNPQRKQTTLFEPLRRAQNLGARWITGAFRTTPSSAASHLAGLIPFHLHVKKLHLRFNTRMTTLPANHLLLTSLPPSIHHSPTSPTPFGARIRSIPATPKLPLHFIASVDADVNVERSHVLPDIARPGDRVLDLHYDQISYPESHPPKDDPAFHEWFGNLHHSLSILEHDFHSLYAYTDGSVSPQRGHHAAAAFRAFHLDQQFRRWASACGRAHSFDAELHALAFALRDLVEHATSSGLPIQTIHLIADNESALSGLFDTKRHTGRHLSILACSHARTWLEADQSHTIRLWWVPSHKNVLVNELVDLDAKAAITELPPSPAVSWAYSRAQASVTVMDEWRQSSHLGSQFPRHQRLRAARSMKGPGPLLAHTSHSNTLTARCTRAITNHAPTGEYRTRFHPREPTYCSTCGLRQTRDHILYHCTRYKRRPNLRAILANSLEFVPKLALFLTKNPSAFTFEDVETNTPAPLPPEERDAAAPLDDPFADDEPDDDTDYGPAPLPAYLNHPLFQTDDD